jgi:hypothetical protein
MSVGDDKNILRNSLTEGKKNNGKSLRNLRPRPTESVHRLLPEGKESVLQMAKKEEYADLAHRILAEIAGDLDLFFVSFPSVYRILRSAKLMPMGGRQAIKIKTS